MKKNSAFCSVLQSHPAVASPKERLYKQMTSNPALTERNIQKSNAYLLYSRQEQKSLVTYHTLQSLYVCVSLVNTLISTAPIGSPIICMRSISSHYLRTMGKEFIFQFSRRSWGRNAWRTPKNVCVGGYYSPRLKRIVVLVYTHEVISTKSERKPSKSTIDWQIKSRVSLKIDLCRIFTHCTSQVYRFANNSVMA